MLPCLRVIIPARAAASQTSVTGWPLDASEYRIPQLAGLQAECVFAGVLLHGGFHCWQQRDVCWQYVKLLDLSAVHPRQLLPLEALSLTIPLCALRMQLAV